MIVHGRLLRNPSNAELAAAIGLPVPATSPAGSTWSWSGRAPRACPPPSTAPRTPLVQRFGQVPDHDVGPGLAQCAGGGPPVYRQVDPWVQDQRVLSAGFRRGCRSRRRGRRGRNRRWSRSGCWRGTVLLRRPRDRGVLVSTVQGLEQELAGGQGYPAHLSLCRRRPGCPWRKALLERLWRGDPGHCVSVCPSVSEDREEDAMGDLRLTPRLAGLLVEAATTAPSFATPSPGAS